MDVTLKLDMRDFERKADELRALPDQIPFALSQAMNKAALETRKSIIDELWPSKVTVRNRGFLGWALRTEFSTKERLVVEVNDNRAQGRGHLALHDKGGTKQAKGRFAIPSKPDEMRTSRGVKASLRPRALRNAFVRNGVIFQRLPGHKLKALYVLKATGRQPADVPFSSFFADRMERSIERLFPPLLEAAMRTRKPR